MKKLYTFLVFAIVVMNVMAQTLSITVNGSTVNNSETVAITLESAKTWIVPNVVPGPFKLDPKIVINSETDQEVTVTATDLDQEDGTLQNCFAGGCLSVKGPAWSESKTALVKVGSTSAEIDVLYGSNDPGDIIRRFKVCIASARESYEFTVAFYVGKYTQIDVLPICTAKNVSTLGGMIQDETSIKKGEIFVKDGKKFLKR